MTAPQLVYSAINETNEMSGSKSLALAITIKSETGNDNLSPVIDTTRLSAHVIRNHLFNPTSGTTIDFVADTAKSGGSSPAKYITKPMIVRKCFNDTLDIRISAYIHSTAEVEMYFRLSDATDARKMQEIVWTFQF